MVSQAQALFKLLPPIQSVSMRGDLLLVICCWWLKGGWCCCSTIRVACIMFIDESQAELKADSRECVQQHVVCAQGRRDALSRYQGQRRSTGLVIEAAGLP